MKLYDPQAVQAAFDAHGFEGRTADAVWLVLVCGVPRVEAAEKIGIHPSAITRMLAKLSKSTTCRCCGHTSKEIEL